MAADALQQTVDRYLGAPTPAHREAVVLASLPLVRSLIGRMSVPKHPLVTQEDLESAGLLGLIQALDTYDPTRGAKFVTFAFLRVRGALVDYLRSVDLLPRKKRQHLSEAQEALATLRQIMGEEPSDQDVADYMGIAVEEYHELMMDAQRRFTLSIDRPVAAEDAPTMLELLPDEDADLDFERIEQRSALAYVEKAIRHLTERQRTVLALYYYENLTLREIGELLGLTEARISQILGKILLTLQADLTRVRPSRMAA